MKKKPQSNLVHSFKARKMKINNKLSSNKKDHCTTEDIWLAIRDEKIDITYAIVGYTYSNGIPIFSSDDMMTLLQMHGYDNSLICEFLMEFAQVHEKNSGTPVLMMSVNKMKIYSDLMDK